MENPDPDPKRGISPPLFAVLGGSGGGGGMGIEAKDVG